MFFVYAIQSLSTKRTYIGQTRDVDQRLSYHNSGYVKSTRDDKPLKLLALQKVPSRNEARWIERQLKKSKEKRKKWIEQNRIGK
ncbi:MAG: GIY-YIG nuclease family protein [Candidatus Aenigmarchaeota archaeon]|nr:GIY-YIG nuclease family protein [Candidatus Aenigmarchaeota archaeon]